MSQTIFEFVWNEMEDVNAQIRGLGFFLANYDSPGDGDDIRTHFWGMSLALNDCTIKQQRLFSLLNEARKHSLADFEFDTKNFFVGSDDPISKMEAALNAQIALFKTLAANPKAKLAFEKALKKGRGKA